MEKNVAKTNTSGIIEEEDLVGRDRLVRQQTQEVENQGPLKVERERDDLIKVSVSDADSNNIKSYEVFPRGNTPKRGADLSK